MNDFVSPVVQAMKLISRIGDEISKSGEPIRQFSIDNHFSVQLIEELMEKGLVKFENKFLVDGGEAMFFSLNLTLQGWERYEAEKRGKLAGNYGFVAMKFGDPDLDPFVRDVVKPAVKEGTGYDLVDMREVSRAGVIDNIMRVQIRNAAFIIADLSHDNLGAYWEAGYAEGLGKPVIYICERSKFEEKQTHFDTNHCTTVLWSTDDPDQFRLELIATLRRSLEDAAKTGP